MMWRLVSVRQQVTIESTLYTQAESTRLSVESTYQEKEKRRVGGGGVGWGGHGPVYTVVWNDRSE